jgi:hypothetical protein
MVALQLNDIEIWCAHNGEKGFQRALESMGIDEKVTVHVVGEDQVPTPPGQLVQPGGS